MFSKVFFICFFSGPTSLAFPFCIIWPVRCSPCIFPSLGSEKPFTSEPPTLAPGAPYTVRLSGSHADVENAIISTSVWPKYKQQQIYTHLCGESKIKCYVTERAPPLRLQRTLWVVLLCLSGLHISLNLTSSHKYSNSLATAVLNTATPHIRSLCPSQHRSCYGGPVFATQTNITFSRVLPSSHSTLSCENVGRSTPTSVLGWNQHSHLASFYMDKYRK